MSHEISYCCLLNYCNAICIFSYCDYVGFSFIDELLECIRCNYPPPAKYFHQFSITKLCSKITEFGKNWKFLTCKDWKFQITSIKNLACFTWVQFFLCFVIWQLFFLSDLTIRSFSHYSNWTPCIFRALVYQPNLLNHPQSEMFFTHCLMNRNRKPQRKMKYKVLSCIFTFFPIFQSNKVICCKQF